MKTIPLHKIEDFSVKNTLFVPSIKIVKKRNYEILEGMTITGDAPKAFIRLYDRELNFRYNEKDGSKMPMKFFRIHKRCWPVYIAKTGQKRYPQESITEHLLSRLGEDFGLCMAKTSLRIINGQLRLLSRYFLNPENEELIHGAEIFAGYIGDEDFIEQVEEEELARELFTLQFIEKAIDFSFPYQKDEIMKNFIKMLLFDALVGNNDRHFYNWGIKRSINQKFQPYFSPVYDTARGLFWNDSEQKLYIKSKNKNERDAYIRKYCKNSRPKIGWEGINNIDHFKLVNNIANNSFFISEDEIKKQFSMEILTKMIKTIDQEFVILMSSLRRDMIKS
ncbi:MAG: HipA domain-containing protein [Muribaculaceae bacterium]|nr:HipA domain-containing protein [Muribaculaceae bacterium]